MMPIALWIALGAVVLGLVVWKVLAPTLDSAVGRTIKERDAGPLIAAIQRLGQGARPDAFNHAIRRLWDNYERELAVPLIRALVEHHTDAPIAQYWLEQVQGVEPELARTAFDAGFFEAHYLPHVAASCGEAG